MPEVRKFDTEVLRPRHKGQVELMRANPDWYVFEPFAPPTPLIVFSRFNPYSGVEQVMSMKADGRDVQNLSRNPAFTDTCPAWSPDRTMIVFARATNRTTPSQLWTMYADGTGQTQLSRPPAGKWDTEPIWSRDNRICFQRFYEVWTIRADGSNEQPVLDYNAIGYPVGDSMPTWAPDNSQVAFARNHGGMGYIVAVEPQGASPSSLITVPAKWRYDGWPAWSPNGDLIAFWRNDGLDMRIWTVSSDGDPNTEVALSHPTRAQGDQAPCWSPDGRKLAFHRIDYATLHIWGMNADGSGEQDLSAVAKPDGNPGDVFPNWA